MDTGLYSACAGLMAKVHALDTIAHNLANTSTTAFKSKHSSFASVLAGEPGLAGPLSEAVNRFGIAGAEWADESSGTLQQTGNSLDLALAGRGQFSIQTKSGEATTRDGHFHVSSVGLLVNEAGDSVLGEVGPLNVSGGRVTVMEDGSISVEGVLKGRLKLIEAGADGVSGVKGVEGVAKRSPNTTVRQGYLESSNANPVEEMVTLIANQRHAQMLNRALSTFYTEFDRTAASELGRV